MVPLFLPLPIRRGHRATGLRFRRPNAGPSHGGMRRTMRSDETCGPPSIYFCSRNRGQRQDMVALLPDCVGILIYGCPSDKDFHRAPFLPNFPCFPSVTRFGAGPAPCGTARLCFALADALRVSAFRKSFVQRTPKHFPNLPKKRRWALGAGHTPTPPHTERVLGTPGSRVASRKSVPRAIRANSIRRN